MFSLCSRIIVRHWCILGGIELQILCWKIEDNDSDCMKFGYGKSNRGTIGG